MRSRLSFPALAALILAIPLHAATISAPVSGTVITGGAATAVGTLRLGPVTNLQLTPSLITRSLTSSLSTPALQIAPGVPEQAPAVTAQQSLENLADSVSKGKNEGIPHFYDQQAAVRSPEAGAEAVQAVVPEIYEGLNPNWVKGQIKQSKQSDRATLALQKKAQTKGFRRTALNKELLKAHNNT